VPEDTLERNSTAPVDELPSLETGALGELYLRDSLRRQIGLLERRLGELFAAAFPRKGIDFSVAAPGGPRVLGVAELEAVRDRLAVRLREAEAELAAQGRREERNRAMLEEMLVAPERYRGVVIRARDIGESSCRTWASEPRFGLLGMLCGWWRVKVSSGCPLASGRASSRRVHSTLFEPPPLGS
jgi:hypothetical protein